MEKAGDLFKLEARVSAEKVKKRRETNRENTLAWFIIREGDKHSNNKYQ
jgi:hypothetical protein